MIGDCYPAAPTKDPPTLLGVRGVMVIAVLALAGCGDDAGTVSESDALQTVEAYYTAAEAGDADAITTLFVEPAGEAFEENLRLEIWNAGQDMTRIDRSCLATGAESERSVVQCEFGDHQYLQRMAGAPATQVRQTFTISQAGIESVEWDYLTSGYGANDAFNAWMSANHPADAAAADCCGGDTVEDALANGELRRHYAELWITHLQQTGCTYSAIGC